jgi:nucleotide-binding universal stress UspA family protein
MYERIMVPLDGSKVAGRSIPHAEEVAKAMGGQVILFHANESILRTMSGEAFGSMSDEKIKKANKHEEEEARGYLSTIAGPLCEKGLAVSEVAVSGNAADAILDQAESKGVEIITMSNHGLSGIKRWVFGSVTDKVLHAGDLPVLVVRAKG